MGRRQHGGTEQVTGGGLAPGGTDGSAAFQVGKCVDLAVEHQEEGKVIGLLSLILQRHRQAEIGYALAAGYRGQGYATEAARGLVDYAFTTLGLHRLSANTNSENVASQRLLERLGMSLEGRLRQAVQREGRWLDKLLYGILLHEWLRE